MKPPPNKYAGRSSRQHKTNAANLKARRLPCWLCGQPIDYTLVWDDDWAFTADHVKPVAHYPDLADDPTNLRPAHRHCNNNRGTSDPRPGLGTRSRNW